MIYFLIIMVFVFMKIGFFESTNFLLFYVFILNDFLGPIVLPIGSSIDLFHAALLAQEQMLKKIYKI